MNLIKIQTTKHLILTTAFLMVGVLVQPAARADYYRVQKKITFKENAPFFANLDSENPAAKPKKTEITNIEKVYGEEIADNVVLRSIPYYLFEGPGTPNIQYVEELRISLDEREKRYFVRSFFSRSNQRRLVNLRAAPEVREIVSDGPVANRIHLTILGDGYTEQEKEKFFADANRITKELFGSDTFASYLGLFQVHAVFVASRTSGIGDGSPNDTAFKLYRTPKGSKRAIMPGNEAALEEALRYAVKTDYPIVIANDEYYGGLGGRFAISTRSEISGMIVLRHELGHNFGNVGEEYDGGSVYSGANSASSEASTSNWSLWKNDYSTYESKLLSGSYVWQNLKGKPYKVKFDTKQGDLISIILSTVGWSTPDDVFVTLDGGALKLEGSFHNDRNFYHFNELNLQGTSHELGVKENLADGDNVLATAFIYSFPPNYNFTEGVTAAFSTFNEYGQKFYRPTHEGCLMRNMELRHFCSVDQENMWLEFLKRVKILDGVRTDATTITVDTPELKDLKIKWFEVNSSTEKELPALAQKFEIKKSEVQGLAKIKFKLELKSSEIRKKDSKLNYEQVITL